VVQPPFPPNEFHPGDEPNQPDIKSGLHDVAEPWTVDTSGGRFRAQLAPEPPVSSLMFLVFFAHYLTAMELLTRWSLTRPFYTEATAPMRPATG